MYVVYQAFNLLYAVLYCINHFISLQLCRLNFDTYNDISMKSYNFWARYLRMYELILSYYNFFFSSFLCRPRTYDSTHSLVNPDFR